MVVMGRGRGQRVELLKLDVDEGEQVKSVNLRSVALQDWKGNTSRDWAAGDW